MIRITLGRTLVRRIVALSVMIVVAPSLALGQTAGTGKQAAHNTKDLHQGIIPLRDGGDFETRSNVFGEWGGISR